MLRLEPDDELALSALPRHLGRVSEALQERNHSRVVPAHGRDELGDAGRARVVREHTREGGSHAAALHVVGDRERDLGRRAVADETCDPNRLGVSVEKPDEDVVVAVDAGELCELELRQTRLRAAEATLARVLTRRANSDDTVSVSPFRRDLR